MRVISQDGTIDVPYENCVFGITLDNCISAVGDIAVSPNEVMNGIMAKYSSRGKALKAMEMLRTKYLSRMQLEGGYDHVNRCYIQPNYWVLPKVFQFPTDDEG